MLYNTSQPSRCRVARQRGHVRAAEEWHEAGEFEIYGFLADRRALMAAARAAEVAEGYSTSCMRVASSEVGVLRWSHGQDDSLAARAWHGRGSLDSMAAAVSGMAWLQPASAAAA